MGCIGMSIDDFERCTPFEFKKIYEIWMTKEDKREQRSWERIRWMGLCSLQPWSKKTLKPTDIAVFPWEIKKEASDKNKHSAKDIEMRYESAKKRYGLT